MLDPLHSGDDDQIHNGTLFVVHDRKGPIMDLVIVAGMQRIEHYEISAYGTNIALATALGEQEVVKLLEATLEEEKQTDIKLTEVTQKHIMAAAMGGGDEGDKSRSGKDKARQAA